MPGRFDPVFGLQYVDFDGVLELWVVVFKDTLKQVPMSGGFTDPIDAEKWVQQNRTRIIEETIERIVL